MRKAGTLLSVYLAYMLEYRAELFLWALAGALPLILLGVWTEAARGGEFPLSPGEFARYFLMVFLVRQATVVWVVWEFERDVVEGRLSFRLLRPLDPFFDHLAAHTAERLARLPFVVLLTLLFFAVTGLTLNHPEWFGEGAPRKLSGTLPGAPYLEGGSVDWLRLAEDLRALGLRGRVADRGEAGEEVWISFRAPGYAADAQVDPRTGAYRMVVTDYGLVAVLNDLHKGRDAPGGWKLFLDLSALFLALVSLTGLLLGVLLPKSRRAALLVLGLGGLLFLALALYAAR